MRQEGRPPGPAGRRARLLAACSPWSPIDVEEHVLHVENTLAGIEAAGRAAILRRAQDVREAANDVVAHALRRAPHLLVLLALLAAASFSEATGFDWKPPQELLVEHVGEWLE